MSLYVDFLVQTSHLREESDGTKRKKWTSPDTRGDEGVVETVGHSLSRRHTWPELISARLPVGDMQGRRIGGEVPFRLWASEEQLHNCDLFVSLRTSAVLTAAEAVEISLSRVWYKGGLVFS